MSSRCFLPAKKNDLLRRACGAYPAPTLHCVAQEIQRRERFARYSPHDPLLKRIFGEDSGSQEDGDGEAPTDGNEGNGDEPESGISQGSPPGT